MLLKPLSLAAAGLAVATQAFLVPPEISQSDIDTVNALAADVEALSVPQHVELNVSCPGCLFHGRGRHHGAKLASDKPSHLELAFSIDHASTGDRLLVNKFPLYPKANPFEYSLKAKVVPDGCVGTAIKELRGHRPRPFPEQELGYHLSVTQSAEKADDGLVLHYITLDVLEVGDVFVDGIPSVQVMLVEDVKTGSLALGGVTQSETAASPAPKQEECTSLMCKWLASVKDKMDKVKGKPCHGKMRGGAKGGRPHRGGHHGGHHHHKGHGKTMFGQRRRHHWGQLLNDVAQHIVLPVVVGIIAGVSVSLIGMMVGSLIVAVWRTFFRRPSQCRRSHSHSKAPESEVAAAEVEEKSGLMEHQDPPPLYDEEAVPTPPAYADETAH